MTAPSTIGGQQIHRDPGDLTLALEELPRGHPEVLAWLAEAKRLFAEAQERFESGQVLPVLSSLAAVPPVHRMLVERCSELLEADDSNETVEPPTRSGMYL